MHYRQIISDNSESRIWEKKSKCRSGIHVSSFLFFCWEPLNPVGSLWFVILTIPYLEISPLWFELLSMSWFYSLLPLRSWFTVGEQNPSNPPKLKLWSSRNWNKTRCPFGASASGLKKSFPIPQQEWSGSFQDSVTLWSAESWWNFSTRMNSNR